MTDFLKKATPFSFLLLCCMFFMQSCTEDKKEHITIATAANMQFAMKKLVAQFSQKTGISCNIIVGSSGKLTSQIKAGAPYDIFVSADMKYPEELYKAGFTHKKPETYAYGRLVLWSIKKAISPTLENLKDPGIRHIAVANPKTAPYGVAALQVLDFYDLKNSVNDKLVYGESIAQTNQFITSQAADIGFTAEAVVLAPGMKNKGNYLEIDQKAYDTISQGIVLIKHKDRNSRQAQLFYDFIFSTEAKQILKSYGYNIPTS